MSGVLDILGAEHEKALHKAYSIFWNGSNRQQAGAGLQMATAAGTTSSMVINHACASERHVPKRMLARSFFATSCSFDDLA